MAMTGMAIAAIAAPVIGGIVGNLMGAGDKRRAEEAFRRAYAQYDGLNIPDIEKQRLALQSPEVQGILQPFMEQAEQLGPTAMEQINIDPRLREAQMNALDTLSKMGSQGLTAEDRAALNAARRGVAGDVQSTQEGIISNLAQRGVGGNAMEMVSRMQAAQAGADRASQETDRLMAMAQRRMLEGAASAGQLGGSIREQEYGEQSNLARARDEIARFNANQRAGVNQRNVAGLNDAQLRNLMEKQRVHEARVGIANQEQIHNKGLYQSQFDNEMALRQARANAAIGQGNQHQRSAESTANMYAGIGAGAGQIAGSVYGSQQKAAAAKNPYVKKEKPMTRQEMLDDLEEEYS